MTAKESDSIIWVEVIRKIEREIDDMLWHKAEDGIRWEINKSRREFDDRIWRVTYERAKQ